MSSASHLLWHVTPILIGRSGEESCTRSKVSPAACCLSFGWLSPHIPYQHRTFGRSIPNIISIPNITDRGSQRDDMIWQNLRFKSLTSPRWPAWNDIGSLRLLHALHRRDFFLYLPHLSKFLLRTWRERNSHWQTRLFSFVFGSQTFSRLRFPFAPNHLFQSSTAFRRQLQRSRLDSKQRHQGEEHGNQDSKHVRSFPTRWSRKIVWYHTSPLLEGRYHRSSSNSTVRARIGYFCIYSS